MSRDDDWATLRTRAMQLAYLVCDVRTVSSPKVRDTAKAVLEAVRKVKETK